VSAAAKPRATSGLRAALLVLEGYTYLLLVVAFFIAGVGLLAAGILARKPLVGLVALVAGVPMVAVALAVTRALFFRVRYLGGIELTPSEAPRLFALVGELRRLVGAPRIHRLVISPDLQASALQMPRLGIFWPRNTLLLGYPLLVLLSEEQLRAVVAHELAHLGRAHGRAAHWLYRTSLSWRRLIGVLSERGAVPIFVYWIARNYIPRLERSSADIAREQERFADQQASEAAGSRAAAEALVVTDVGERILRESFWPMACDVRQTELPQPYMRMRYELRVRADEASTAVLAELLEELTNETDSHPALAERLAALGERAAIPNPPTRSAGDAIVPEHMDRFAEHFDAEWRRLHGDDWLAESTSDREARERLAALEAQSSPSAAEVFERATIVEELDGPADALPLYQSALEIDSNNAGAAIAAGRILLERNDPAGVALVERAVAIDEQLLHDACELIVPYYRARNRLVEAERWRRRGVRQAVLEKLGETTPG
jgi:Zn-dependent protease with chaperone function